VRGVLLGSEGDTDLTVDRQGGVRPRGQDERADVGADEEHSKGNEPDDARLEIEIVRDVAGAGSRGPPAAFDKRSIAQTELGPNRHSGKLSSCNRLRTRRAARFATALTTTGAPTTRRPEEQPPHGAVAPR
jgi:hypothetical protein